MALILISEPELLLMLRVQTFLVIHNFPLCYHHHHLNNSSFLILFVENEIFFSLSLSLFPYLSWHHFWVEFESGPIILFAKRAKRKI